MTLVLLNPAICPDCGTAVRIIRTHQPALIRHGGYGATQTVALRVCTDCGYIHVYEWSETRP